MARTDLWFKAKLYGWGWTPITWQGWLVTILYCLGSVAYFSQVDINTHSVVDMLLWFGLPFTLFTGAPMAICYTKGEKPRWRWGK